ncbi:RagB/SusD family nutrient uptake outer membrane protein [Sphingobacterium sp. Mn56C]|uniref:RagB/SusD family nutrient uptake outer membrane protein n=1 Tax=Sphingobacterium sp. Mn56C TaxID=3395261 RepID=UPI003BCB41CB
MKTNALLTCLCAALLLFISSSCNKWLDIQPNDRVSDETLFEQSDGFRTALNGIYQLAATPDLYGRNLTWGFASAMGNDYYAFQLPEDLKNAATPDLNHTSLRGLLKNVWGKSYTIIASCNKLIQEIDKKDDSFFQYGATEKNLIKGEALALRALLHFDMVRIFAPSPALKKDEYIVPYQDTYPAHFAERLPTDTILLRIATDLEAAKSLVAENDTLKNSFYLAGGISYTMNGVTGNQGIFFSFRMNRMNFVAISTLLARVYLYAGDYPKAKQAAQFVYKTYGPEGKRWFSFTAENFTNNINRYQKLPEDILLAFYDPMLLEKIKDFKGTQYPMRLHLSYQSFFPSNERDYRRNILNTVDNVTFKWLESTEQKAQNKILPVIRLSEAYYIYSECLYREGNTAEALNVLNKMRAARGKSNAFTDESEKGYFDELMMEYRRDYFTEGQTIFAHKRLNRPMTLGAQVIEINTKFTAPLPEDER